MTIPDFSSLVHVRENSPENEKHLNANRYHFTGQGAVILSLLQQGKVVTGMMLVKQYNISDGLRRIRELREAGVEISEDWVYDDAGKKTRFKKFWIAPKTDKEERKKEVPYRKDEPASTDHSKKILEMAKESGVIIKQPKLFE